MEIQSNLTVLNATQGRAVRNSLAQLRVGQIIPASVVKNFADTGQAQLNLGGYLVRAQSDLVLVPGQRLELKVIETGDRPQLRIVNPITTEIITRKALLDNVAIQKSPALLPGQLIGIAKAASGLESLPEQIRTLAQRLMTSLPSLNDLSSFPGIRQAIGGSGIYLEARLASSHGAKNDAFDQDLKANLLRFAASAEPEIRPQESESGKQSAVGESSPDTESNLTRTLAESARGALSKIVLDQISSLPQDPSGKQVWNLEIPFLNSDRAESARLMIQREAAPEASKKAQQWTVVVELSPPNLGTLQCKIKLSGDQVSAFFRTDSDSTRNCIQDHMGLLEKQLNDAGLRVGYLVSGTGLAPTNPRFTGTESLFDEHV